LTNRGAGFWREKVRIPLLALELLGSPTVVTSEALAKVG